MNTPTSNDGGPAFPGTSYIPGRGNCQPVTLPNGQVEWQEMSSGMSLRDWFAVMALQGKATRLNYPHEHRDILASDCYAIADAMLAAREVKP